MKENGTSGDDPRRQGSAALSRRRVLAGLAGTAGLLGVSLASRVAFGSGSSAGTPRAAASPGAMAGSHAMASPTDSPAASPMDSPAAANRVTISNFAFSPPAITVAAGTEVRWTNQDDIPHTVTSNDGTSFSSPLLDSGDEFHQRFPKPGTYPYHCALHPFMTGKVIVR